MGRWQRAAVIIAAADCVYTASSVLRSSSRGPGVFDTRHRAVFTTPPKPLSSARLAGGPRSGGEDGRGGGALFRWEHVCTVIDVILSSALALRLPCPPPLATSLPFQGCEARRGAPLCLHACWLQKVLMSQWSGVGGRWRFDTAPPEFHAPRVSDVAEALSWQVQ